MRSKAENREQTQGVCPGSPAIEKVPQLLLGMVAGMVAAKQDLMEWVQELGLTALNEVFEADADDDRGPEGQAPGRA